MPFFSLQPQQTAESNLSKFASGMPSLEHVGSSASYLDPSLGEGETLHSPFEDEATQLKQGMAGSSIMHPTGGGEGVGGVEGSGGQYQSSVTGTQFRTPTSTSGGSTLPSGATSQTLASALTGAKQAGSLVNAALKPGQTPGSDLALGFQQPDFQSPDFQVDTTGFSFGGQDFEWTPEAVAQYLQNPPVPGDGDAFSFGADTQLDSSWLDEYTAGTTDPTTGSRIKGFGDLGGADYMSLASAGYSGYQTIQSMIDSGVDPKNAAALAGTIWQIAQTTGITSALGSAAPYVGPAIQLLGTVSGEGGSIPGVESAQGVIMAGAAGPVAVVAAMVIQVAMMMKNHFEARQLASNEISNPIKGKLYSESTEATGRANQILDQLGPDLTSIGTDQLVNSLVGSLNILPAYYRTGQTPIEAVRASESAGSPGTLSKAEYTQRFTTARDKLAGVLQELLNRGMTYEQLGQLPVTGEWSDQTLDAGGRPEDFYKLAVNQPHNAQSQAIMSRILSSPGIEKRLVGPPEYGQYEYFVAPPSDATWNEYGVTSPGQPSHQGTLWAGLGNAPTGARLDPSWLSPEDLFQAASAAPNRTSMYGGPVWEAAARMGISQFSPLIQQHFNPYAPLESVDPASLLGLLTPGVHDDYAQQQWFANMSTP